MVSFIGGGNRRKPPSVRPVASHWQTLSHNVVSSKPRHERVFELTTLVVIGTDCMDENEIHRQYTQNPEVVYEAFIKIIILTYIRLFNWGRRGRDRMVIRFTTTCAIRAYHH